MLYCSDMATTTRTYKIGIDCRLAGKAHAGIGRYIENLVRELVEIQTKKSIRWVLFFHDIEQASEVLPEIPENVSVKFVPIRHYSIKEQTDLPRIFTTEELDLLHIPHFNIPLLYRKPLVVTIHDLLWHEYKGTHVTTLSPWKYWLKYQVYLFTVRQAVTRALHIIVPSKSVKETVLNYYPNVAEKIEVIYEGVDQQVKSRSLSKNPSKTLVYIGSLYPHKNIVLVLNALKELPEYTLQLIGTRNVFQDEVRAQVKELGVEKQVEFLGYQTDEQVREILQKSHALIQPSLFEGFGLTGIEAMQTGVPVIASDIPVFREIYQDAAIFFDPHSTESFILGVKQVESQSSRQALYTAGLDQAKKYRWDTMAKQTNIVYEKILATLPKA